MRNEPDNALGIVLSLGLVIGGVWVVYEVKELIEKHGLPSWSTIIHVILGVAFIALVISTIVFVVNYRYEKRLRKQAEIERDQWFNEHGAVVRELEKWRNHPKLQLSTHVIDEFEDRILAWKQVLGDVPVEELIQELKERLLEEIDACNHR